MTKAFVTSAIAVAALLSGTAAFAASKPQPHATPTRAAAAKAGTAKSVKTVTTTTVKKTK